MKAKVIVKKGSKVKMGKLDMAIKNGKKMPKKISKTVFGFKKK